MNKFPSAALPQAVRCLAVAALLPVLLGGAAPSRKEAAPKARKILARAEQIRSPEQDYTVELSLKVTDPTTFWKERGAAYMLIAHGKDYSFIMMREPKAFYSGTLLIDRGLYWLLLPRSEKPIQLAARQVLSGDIANGDLARGNLIKYYDVRLDGEEVVREEPCWRLELTRTGSDPSPTSETVCRSFARVPGSTQSSGRSPGRFNDWSTVDNWGPAASTWGAQGSFSAGRSSRQVHG